MQIERPSPGDPSSLASALAETFERLHGRRPLGCFAAPGRVNLVGEHTDYNGGLCLPLALPYATYAALAPRDDSRITVRSLQQEEPWEGTLRSAGPGEVDGWPAYAAGVLWAMAEMGIAVPGMDVVVSSTVPLGAGVSSSAALECSVALGAATLAGLGDTPDLRGRLVEACVRAETEVAGAPTGGMDQTVSLCAEAGHALLLDCSDGSTAQVPWSPEDHGAGLLVVDTRASHALNDGGYGARRVACERAADELGVTFLRDLLTGGHEESAWSGVADPEVRRRVRHVLTEIERVELAVTQIRKGDLAGLGETFNRSHASLRDDFEVSCAELDEVVTVAGAHGALGARMTGGGFGGSAIVLCPRERSEAVCAAIAESFAERGWAAPAFLDARGGRGARRIS